MAASPRGNPRPSPASHQGMPGHPVLLARELFEAVAELDGDAGARDLVGTKRTVIVERGARAMADVDTPEDLARLRRDS